MAGIGVGDPFSPKETTTPLFPISSQTSASILTPGLTTASPFVQPSILTFTTPTTPTPTPTPISPFSSLFTTSEIVTVTKSNVNSAKSTVSSTAATLIITNPSVQNDNHKNTISIAATIFGIMIGLIILGGCVLLIFTGRKVPQNKKKKNDIIQRDNLYGEDNDRNEREERIFVHSQINSISPPLNLPPPPPRHSPPLPLPPLPTISSSSPPSSPPPPPTPPPQHPPPLPPQNPSVVSNKPPLMKNLSSPPLTRNSSLTRNLSRPPLTRNLSNPPLTRNSTDPSLTRNSTNPSLTRNSSSPFLTLARSTSNPYITRNSTNTSKPSITRNYSLVRNYIPEHSTVSNNYYQRYSSLRSQTVNHDVEVLPPPKDKNEDINEPP